MPSLDWKRAACLRKPNRKLGSGDVDRFLLGFERPSTRAIVAILKKKG